MKTRKGYKVYPLTSAQKLHFYCLKYCPKKQVLNIGSSLTIQVDLDWDVLKSCIQEAIARCDTMRLRFTHDKEGSIYQYVVKEETKAFSSGASFLVTLMESSSNCLSSTKSGHWVMGSLAF